MESGVWSHFGIWSLESVVIPESGVRNLESPWSLVAEVWSHSGVWCAEVWSNSGVWNM